MIQKRWKVNLLHFDRHTNNVKKLARGGRANNTTKKKWGEDIPDSGSWKSLLPSSGASTILPFFFFYPFMT